MIGTTRFAGSWHLANGVNLGPTLNSAVIEGPTGNLYLDGVVVSPAAADYAEMFETIDGNPIDVGYFVTLDGDKIRRATASDAYVLGVVSATPAMIADASDLRWHDLFVRDEWGRVQYHEVTIPAKLDDEGNVIRPAFPKTEPILNPAWDASQTYIPRLQRVIVDSVKGVEDLNDKEAVARAIHQYVLNHYEYDTEYYDRYMAGLPDEEPRSVRDMLDDGKGI